MILGWSEDRVHVGAATQLPGAFVIDVDGKGEIRWSNLFHRIGSEYRPIGLAVDGAGNTVIAQGASKYNVVRITKIDPAGATLWFERIPSGSVDVDATAVAADPQGNILLAGRGHARFGSAPDLPGGLWLAKLDPAGALLWWKPLPIWTVTADADGDALLVSGSAATKLDPSGAVLWSHNDLAGVGDAVIAAGPAGRMIVAGTFSGTLDLAGSHVSSGAGAAVVLAAFAR